MSKIGLAGLTELTARAWRRGIRVCGIAPSVTLVSGPQSRDNFDAGPRLNALGRGVEVEEIVAALRFIIATPTITGQTITLDGGQRFLSPAARRAIPGGRPMNDLRTPRRPRARRARAAQPQDRARGLCAASSTSAFTISRSASRSGCSSRSRSGWTRRSFAAADEAGGAWDYDFLRTEIGALVAGRRFNLQETLVARDLRSRRGPARRDRASRRDPQARHLSRLRGRRRGAVELLDARCAELRAQRPSPSHHQPVIRRDRAALPRRSLRSGSARGKVARQGAGEAIPEQGAARRRGRRLVDDLAQRDGPARRLARAAQHGERDRPAVGGLQENLGLALARRASRARGRRGRCR